MLIYFLADVNYTLPVQVRNDRIEIGEINIGVEDSEDPRRFEYDQVNVDDFTSIHNVNDREDPRRFEYDQVNVDDFTSIHDVNRPWAYKGMEGQWINFDCTDCIQLELAYFIYSKSF